MSIELSEHFATSVIDRNSLSESQVFALSRRQLEHGADKHTSFNEWSESHLGVTTICKFESDAVKTRQGQSLAKWGIGHHDWGRRHAAEHEHHYSSQKSQTVRQWDIQSSRLESKRWIHDHRIWSEQSFTRTSKRAWLYNCEGWTISKAYLERQYQFVCCKQQSKQKQRRRVNFSEKK